MATKRGHGNRITLTTQQLANDIFPQAEILVVRLPAAIRKY